jgi:hypothetical protein
MTQPERVRVVTSQDLQRTLDHNLSAYVDNTRPPTPSDCLDVTADW